MRGRAHPLREMFQQGGIYAVGNAAAKIVGLLLMPLCLNPRFLAIEAFNLWGILVPTAQILAILVGLGLNQGLLRYYADPAYIAGQKLLAASVFSTTALLSVAIVALGLAAAWFVFAGQVLAWMVVLLSAYVAAETVLRIPLDLLRAQERPTQYAVATVLKLGLTFGLTIYLLISHKAGIWALLWGQLGGSAIALGYLIFVQRHLLLGRLSWTWLKIAMKYGVPLIVASLSSMVLNMGDRYLIEAFLGETEKGPVAIYTLAAQIAGVLNMLLVQSFNLVFLVIALRASGGPDGGRSFYRSIFRIFGLMLLWSAMGLSLLAKEVVDVLMRYLGADPVYQTAPALVPLMVYGYVFFGMANVVAIGLHLSARTGWISGAIFVSMVFNLGLNLVLIPRLGLWGAALATLLAYGLLFGVSNWSAERLHPVGYPIAFFIKWMAVASLVTVILLEWPDGPLWLRASVKLLAIFGFALMLLLRYRAEIKTLLARTGLPGSFERAKSSVLG